MDERRHRVFASLLYTDAPAAIRWLQEAFEAVPVVVVAAADDEDRVAHAEMRIGGSIFFVASSAPELPADHSEQPPGTASIYLLVDDVAATYDHALAAGGRPVRPPQPQADGTVIGTVRDFEGNLWRLGTYRPSGG